MPDNPGYTGSGPGLDVGDVEEYARLFGDAWNWLTGGGNEQPAGSPGTAVVPYSAPTTTAYPSGGTGVGPCGPSVVAPVMKQRRSCPPGYVLVTDRQTGAAACMRRDDAIRCKLYKPPRKPPIKASDWRCLMKSASVMRKLDTVVKKGNQIVGKAKYTRSRGRGR